MKLKLERNMNMCNLATSYAVLPDGDAQPHTAHVNKPITFLTPTDQHVSRHHRQDFLQI